MPPPPYSIRASLIGLVTACIAPALLVSGYLVHDHYAQQRERIERDTLLQARNLAVALDRELSGVILGLRMLSTSPGLVADDCAVSTSGRAAPLLSRWSTTTW